MAVRRESARTRAAAPFIAGLFVLGLVGCSATPSTAPSTPTIAPSVAATSVPTAAPTEATAEPPESASAAPSPASGAAACTASSLKASHDLVEGAAGSRLTTVVLVAGQRCSVALYPAMGLRDADGTELVGSAAAGQGRIDLDPNISYSSAVQFANWCNPDPSFPLSLVIRIGAAEVGVSGSSFPEAGDMPPCNGAGGPTLSAGAWEAMH
jgi:hypothetical protein